MIDLIRPVREGRDLLAEIASTHPTLGQIAIWWLGQSGFLIKSRKGMMLIDPYLSEHLTKKYENTSKPHIRMTAAPFRGGDLSGVDLILCSHKHSDHMDPGTLPDLTTNNPNATLIVPCALVDHARGLGVDSEQIIAMDAGDVHAQSGFLVRAIPSAHEAIDLDADGRHLYLGFVIETDGFRFYHSGDSVVFGELERWLGIEPFDILFLPINGREPSRGVAGNMTAAEAVNLAALVRPDYLVPHHYDMFTFNTVPIAEFEREAAHLPDRVIPRVLSCGERWLLSRP